MQTYFYIEHHRVLLFGCGAAEGWGWGGTVKSLEPRVQSAFAGVRK